MEHKHKSIQNKKCRIYKEPCRILKDKDKTAQFMQETNIKRINKIFKLKQTRPFSVIRCYQCVPFN